MESKIVSKEKKKKNIKISGVSLAHRYPAKPCVQWHSRNNLSTGYVMDTLSILVCEESIIYQFQNVIQECQYHRCTRNKYLVQKVCKHCLKARFARNTFSMMVCKENIQDYSMPGLSEAHMYVRYALCTWVCQAYLVCWNICGTD